MFHVTLLNVLNVGQKWEGDFLKIAIASDGKEMNSKITDHFGRCLYFTFVDIEDGKIKKTETKKNPYYEKHEPFKVPAFIKREGASTLITGGIGPKAIDKLNEDKICVFQSNKKVKDAIDDFLNDKTEKAGPCKHEG